MKWRRVRTRCAEWSVLPGSARARTNHSGTCRAVGQENWLVCGRRPCYDTHRVTSIVQSSRRQIEFPKVPTTRRGLVKRRHRRWLDSRIKTRTMGVVTAGPDWLALLIKENKLVWAESPNSTLQSALHLNHCSFISLRLHWDPNIRI